MAFSSREYQWSDLTVIVGGKDIVGIQALKYGQKQDKKHKFGKGNLPISVQGGNITPDGEVEFSQSEYQTLLANSKDNSVLSLQVDFLVAFGNLTAGDVITTEKLKGVQFTEEYIDTKQGDTDINVKLPFVFLRKEKVL